MVLNRKVCDVMLNDAKTVAGTYRELLPEVAVVDCYLVAACGLYQRSNKVNCYCVKLLACSLFSSPDIFQRDHKAFVL